MRFFKLTDERFLFFTFTKNTLTLKENKGQQLIMIDRKWYQ